MNYKLVDQLFSQATYDPSRMVNNVYHPYIPLQYSGEPIRFSITQEQYHKFAELIVEKCIQACLDNAEDVDNRDVFRTDKEREQAYRERWGTGSYECAELITQLFQDQHRGITTLIEED
jgi:hypothetical protein